MSAKPSARCSTVRLPGRKTLRYANANANANANASGALAVSHKGPMEGLSSLRQIEQCILEQSHAGPLLEQERGTVTVINYVIVNW